MILNQKFDYNIYFEIEKKLKYYPLLCLFYIYIKCPISLFDYFFCFSLDAQQTSSYCGRYY